jgi:hypothetical protein
MGVVSKRDFAELAGISPSAVSKLIARGRLPVSGGGIDTDDNDVQSYLAKKGINPGAKPKKTKRPSRKGRGRPTPPDDVDISGLVDKDTLTRRKLAAQAQQIELKNAQIEGRLVAREVMIRGVWNPLETFLVRILTDGAKTMASTVYPLAKSGGTREEIEVAIRSELTSFIGPLKDSIQRALKLQDVQH